MSASGRVAPIVAVALASALAAWHGSVPAATQTFKCIIDKRTVYQQQACPVTADLPAASAAAASATARGGSAPASAAAPAHGLSPGPLPASSAPATRR
jgi:hypothetical protein